MCTETARRLPYPAELQSHQRHAGGEAAVLARRNARPADDAGEFIAQISRAAGVAGARAFCAAVAVRDAHHDAAGRADRGKFNAAQRAERTLVAVFGEAEARERE